MAIASRLPPPNGADGTIRLTLPVPPTVNRMWRTTRLGGVYKDPSVVKYQKIVAAYVMAERVVPILTGDLTVYMDWHRAKKIGDTDNRMKVLLDGLGKGLCYADDAQVKKLVIERHDGLREKACVEVLIRRYSTLFTRGEGE